MKFVFILFLFFPVLAKCQSTPPGHISPGKFHQENDTLVWETISTFSILFNKSDTNAMKQFLPDDFLLQWLHENFISKKNVIKTMRDPAVHATFMHTIVPDHKAIIRYSDDYTAVSVNTSFEFLDSVFLQNIKKQKGYGVCIAYLQKINNKWVLKTLHLDLHCSLCDL